MTRAIFFDLGGTLDGGVHWLDRFLALYAQLGMKWPREKIRQAFDKADAKCGPTPMMAEADLSALVRQHVRWQLEALQSRESKLEEALVENFVGPMKAAAAANRQMLAELSEMGLELGVVSNGCGNVARLCQEFGFASYLSVIIDSHRVRLFKPDPAIYLHAAKALGEVPENILMVGDSLERDVRPAKSIGMQTAWLQTDESKHTGEADFELRSLSELPGKLSGVLV